MFSAKAIKVNKVETDGYEFETPTFDSKKVEVDFSAPEIDRDVEYVELNPKAFTTDTNEIKESLDSVTSEIKSGIELNATFHGLPLGNGVYVGYEDNVPAYKRLDPETGLYHNISIFDEENCNNGQYGADQGVFENDFDRLIRDPIIWNEMQKYYPVDSFSSRDEAMEFYERYFTLITHVGCGYAVGVNTIFKEYEGREKEFEETFGYPMYRVGVKGNVDFNYEYLFLEYYNYCWAGKYSLEEMERGMEITNNIQDFFRTDAISTAADISNLDDFLRDEYNINCTAEMDWHNRFTIYSNDDSINNFLREEYSNNDYITYSGANYDLYTMDGELYYEHGGPHYMLITGFTDDGRPIVTSWGQEFILDVKGDKNGTYRTSKINF